MDGHIRFDTKDCALLLLDQRRLPLAEETFACRTVDDVVYALRTMVVRGAPAIGWGRGTCFAPNSCAFSMA